MDADLGVRRLRRCAFQTSAEWPCFICIAARKIEVEEQAHILENQRKGLREPTLDALDTQGNPVQ